MYTIPPNEMLVENRTCKQCAGSFPITDKDMEFYAKMSPTFDGKQYVIPAPTLCPDCRQQRRLSFRNERTLYKRKCDATGRDMVSMYSPDTSYTVYHQDYWWSDAWDPMSYGREVDLGRSMMTQMEDLMREIPKMHLSVFDMENSDYANQSGSLKNCYLVTNSSDSNHCYYGAGIYHSSNCVDFLRVWKSENCYQCIDCKNCYNLFYSQNCLDCRDSQYLEDCINCSNCFGCSSIHGKQYWIYNNPYDKVAYFTEIEKMQKAQLKNSKKLTSIKKNLIQINAENSIGNYIYDSKDTLFSFDIFESEQVKYSSDMTYAKDIMDVDFFGVHLQNTLDSAIIGINASRIRFCIECWSDVENIFYCFGCVNATKDCFACVGLRNKQYCILNKQYTKEEYEVLVPKIIEKMMADGEWGEFFPSSMSPFGYNETVANEYYPLTKSEATKDNIFNWSDYEAPFPTVEKVIPASRLPDTIESIPDDILNWAIECEVTKKPFRIIKQELEFYRKHSLPIPRRHPDQRHRDRMALRNPRKLYERVCDCIHCEQNWKRKRVILDDSNSEGSMDGKRRKKMITTYTPERPERVYCEVCYDREVMG